jgi:uncharacterized membrane-anchored protein
MIDLTSPLGATASDVRDKPLNAGGLVLSMDWEFYWLSSRYVS